MMGRHRVVRSRACVLAAVTLVFASVTTGVTIGVASGAQLPSRTLSIGSTSVSEGDSGIHAMRFPVTLSARSTTVTTVFFKTVPGSALAGSDYIASIGKVTIPAGKLSGTAVVNVIGDTSYEPDETFVVALLKPVGAALSKTKDRATGTIINDDPPPSTAMSWGDNAAGALGNATVSSGHVISPTRLGKLNNWSSVSSGDGYSLALRTDGTLWGWGNNRRGQLGDGSTANRSEPERIGTQSNWASVFAGGEVSDPPSGQLDFSVGIKKDGTLWAWGDNSVGQLGDGTKLSRLFPEQIGSANNWATISASNGSTLAIKSDGTLWVWGNNSSGQLGDGTTQNRSAPEQIGSASDWKSVSGGGGVLASYTLALKTDGTLWAWGANDGYQLGDLTTESRTAPEQIDPGLDVKWTVVSAGRGVVGSPTPPYASYSLAIDSHGSLWAWGDNSAGELGDSSNDSVPDPEQVGPETNWASVSTGFLGATGAEPYSVGIRTDGSLWAWGANSGGELGDGTTTGQLTPEQIGPDTNWSTVATGVQGTIGIRKDGSLWVWGNSSGGSLGLGSFDSSSVPVSVSSAGPWKSIVLGYHFDAAFAMGIKADGSLWGWGSNDSGELGDGTVTNAYVPERIGTDTNWETVSAGGDHTVAIRTDGTLWAWGNNGYGQLGDGTTRNQLSPEQIGTANNWQVVSAGADDTVAIRTDGTLWAWGNNSTFQLGDGTSNRRLVPEQISKPSKNWKVVSAGAGQTFGIRTDGSLWAWGNGPLGDGGPRPSSVPERIITSLKGWRAVTADIDPRGGGTLAIRTDGSLWAWGPNTNGELGDGSTTTRLIPERIGTSSNWDAVATSGSHTIALRGDHSLWAWGDNSAGELGDSGTKGRDTPKRIGTVSTWDQIAAAGRDTIALAN